MSYSKRLPDATRMRAEAMGEAGLRWVAALDGSMAYLQEAWDARFGTVLQGGSESLVAEAVLADGREAVVKVGLPAYGDLSGEARVYGLAGGRGYAELLAWDRSVNALLLERLGEPLRDACATTEAQLAALCRTLEDAWVALPDPEGLMTGAEKARWLKDFIEEKWSALGRPCDRPTRDRALSFAEEREDAFTPANAVLVHGDAHAENALRAPSLPGGRFKFVDPDGMHAEKACDLAVPMREWSAELLAGDTGRLARERCEMLAAATGVDATAIWQWGYVERVSTGLTMLDIGMREEGLESLAVAERIRRS